MKYLIRKKGKKQKAHYWNGVDTACRMYSSNGLKKDRYVVYDDRNGKDVCHMCINNFNNPKKSFQISFSVISFP